MFFYWKVFVNDEFLAINRRRTNAVTLLSMPDIEAAVLAMNKRRINLSTAAIRMEMCMSWLKG